jgi:hypothetical protein
MSEQETVIVKEKEDWMNAKWRPMMGWMYMLVCTCDFVIFPVLWSILHALMHDGNVTQWNPLTLQGAGLFHMAMGAIIGVAAFGRTQEKLAGKANDNGGIAVSTSFGAPSTPTPSAMSSGFGSVPLGGNTASSFSAPAFGSTPTASSQVVTGFGGKPAPVQPDQPII